MEQLITSIKFKKRKFNQIKITNKLETAKMLNLKMVNPNKQLFSRVKLKRKQLKLTRFSNLFKYDVLRDLN